MADKKSELHSTLWKGCNKSSSFVDGKPQAGRTESAYHFAKSGETVMMKARLRL